MEDVTFSVLVPSNSPVLSKALREKIKEQNLDSKIDFKKSPDKFCHVHVNGGICGADTWWTINKLVLQVERTHRGRHTERVAA